MSGQIQVTFKNFTLADVAANLPSAKKGKLGVCKPPGPLEERLIRAGLEGVAVAVPSRAPRIKSLLGLLSPPSPVMKVLGSVPGLKVHLPSPDFTIAVGFVGSAGAGLSAGAGGGIYFWNKSPSGEVGLFGSISVGIITNAGVSAGDSFAFLFDKAPTVLRGDIITLEVDVEIPPVTVGGQLFLTAPPVSLWPPALTGAWTPEIVGVGFQVTVGVSALPINIAVTPSRTWIRPLTP
jgi:hypothetical protein